MKEAKPTEKEVKPQYDPTIDPDRYSPGRDDYRSDSECVEGNVQGLRRRLGGTAQSSWGGPKRGDDQDKDSLEDERRGISREERSSSREYDKICIDENKKMFSPKDFLDRRREARGRRKVEIRRPRRAERDEEEKRHRTRAPDRRRSRSRSRKREKNAPRSPL